MLTFRRVGKRRKRDGWAEEVAAARGLDVEILPHEELPTLSQEIEFFLVASSHLMTCRSFGMAPGPVPWTAVVQYCHTVGYDNWEKMMSIVSQVAHALDEKEKPNAE